MADSARRDVELRVRAVLEGGGTLREAREEVNRWTREMRDQTDAYRANNRALQERIRLLRDEQQQTRQGGGAAGPERLFGLRPYELQNLSYQINDVVSQLASGAHLTQVIAQQGGQIFQLWGRNLFSIGAYLPQLAAGIGTVTLALKVFEDTTRRMAAERQFGALLGTMADGARFSRKDLADLQVQITKLGIAWDEAGQIIRSGLQRGVTQEGLLPLAAIARNIAVPRGQDVGKTFDELAEGLQKGGEGVADFNKQLGILNATELQLIRDTERSQGLIAAQRIAIQLLGDKTKDAADNAGLFTRELKELKAAWLDLLDTLQQRGVVSFFINEIKLAIQDVKEFVKSIDDLVQGIKKLRDEPIRALPGGAGVAEAASGSIETGIRFFMGKGLSYEQATGITAAFANESGRGVALDPNAVNPQSGAYGIAQALGSRQPAYRRAQGLMGQLEVAWQEFMTTEANALARIKETTEAGAAAIATSRYFERPARFPGDPQAEALAQRSAATARGFAGRYRDVIVTPGGPATAAGSTSEAASDERARRQRESDALRATQAAIDASAQALKIDNERYDIEHDLNGERAKAAVYARAFRELSQQGLRDDDLRAAVNRRVFDFEVQRAETLRKFEQDKANQRITDGKHAAEIDAAGIAAREKAIALARGAITLEQAQTAEMQGREEARKKYANEEAARVAQRRLDQDLAQRALGVDIKGYSDLNGLLDALAQKQKAQREQRQKEIEDARGKGFTLREDPALLAQIEARERATTKADFYLKQLNALQQTRQDTITAVNASVAAGGMTIGEGEEAIKRAFEATTPEIEKQTKAFQEFLATTKDLDPTKVDQYTAKIKQMRAEAQYVSPLFKTIRDTFEQSFSTNISTAFNTIAEAIGGLIAKTKSWHDVMVAVRTASLNFFASLLRDIASAILRYEALKLASSLFGIKDIGGSGGLFSFLFGTGAKAVSASTTSSAATASVPIVTLHRGGIVGRGAQSGMAPGWWFAGAPRYHAGTLVGLAADEQAAILRRGEEVLAADNPRNIMNGGGRGEIAIRNVLVDDPRRIPEAMSGAVGERVIVQTLVKNAATIRELVKG